MTGHNQETPAHAMLAMAVERVLGPAPQVLDNATEVAVAAGLVATSVDLAIAAMNRGEACPICGGLRWTTVTFKVAAPPEQRTPIPTTIWPLLHEIEAFAARDRGPQWAKVERHINCPACHPHRRLSVV